MTGIDRHTGCLLDGWAHVRQSLAVIFATLIGARVMRRTFGSAIPGLLGQNLTPATLLRFYTAIILSVELWEPRYRVRRVSYPAASNSAALLSQGLVGLQLEGEYRPRGHLGDPTPAGVRTLAWSGAELQDAA